MAGEIASAFVSIIPSFKGGASALSRELGGAAGSAGADAGKTAGGKFSGAFGGAIKGVGGILAGAFVVGAAVDFFGSAISGASDLNETVNKSNTIFGDQADEIDKWASTAATSVGLSKTAALDAAAGFGNMFSQLGFAGGEAASMATDVVGLSADLGSFNNLPTADVADKIGAAFRGEYDSLQSLIPNINAARVEQEAMAETGKTSADQLTAQEKAAAVLAIVHRDGAAAMGDFAETSDGAANKQKILGAKLENLKTIIGQKLLPVADKLLDWGLDLVDNLATGGDAVANVGGVFGDVFSTIGGFLSDNKATFQGWYDQLKAIFDNLKTLVSTVVGFITDFWESHGAQIMASVMTVWNAIKTVITSALTIIKGIIQLVISVITGDWSAAWDAIKLIVSSAWTAIKSVVTIAIEAVKTVLTVAWALIQSVATIAWDAIKSAITGVWDKLVAAANIMKDGISTAFDNVVTFVTGIPDRITEVLTGLWDFITTEAGELKEDVSAKMDTLLDWIQDLPGLLASKAGDIFGWIVDAAANAAADAWNAIADSFGVGGEGADGSEQMFGPRIGNPAGRTVGGAGARTVSAASFSAPSGTSGLRGSRLRGGDQRGEQGGSPVNLTLNTFNPVDMPSSATVIDDISLVAQMGFFGARRDRVVKIQPERAMA